ncbi:MAG: hypothetical protein WBM99_06855 [Psychromonas sp.]
MMSAQMQFKTLAFDEHGVFAAIYPESALYMIGAVDEIKAHNKEEKHEEPSAQQQDKENNVNTDAA